MAKTAKLKKKDISIHSRAARRANSPSINTDKSLKAVKPPLSNSHVHIFSAQSNGGVKKRKSKGPTRQQRLEREKRLERADIVNARLEKRVEESVGKLKKVKERKKEWGALNGKMAKMAKTSGEVDEDMWEDVAEDETAALGEGKKEEQTGEFVLPIIPLKPPAHVSAPLGEEDEVL